MSNSTAFKDINQGVGLSPAVALARSPSSTVPRYDELLWRSNVAACACPSELVQSLLNAYVECSEVASVYHSLPYFELPRSSRILPLAPSSSHPPSSSSSSSTSSISSISSTSSRSCTSGPPYSSSSSSTSGPASSSTGSRTSPSARSEISSLSWLTMDAREADKVIKVIEKVAEAIISDWLWESSGSSSNGGGGSSGSSNGSGGSSSGSSNGSGVSSGSSGRSRVMIIGSLRGRFILRNVAHIRI